jgi:hypothetical protein
LERLPAGGSPVRGNPEGTGPAFLATSMLALTPASWEAICGGIARSPIRRRRDILGKGRECRPRSVPVVTTARVERRYPA